jgi:hypothetical protein
LGRGVSRALIVASGSFEQFSRRCGRYFELQIPPLRYGMKSKRGNEKQKGGMKSKGAE